MSWTPSIMISGSTMGTPGGPPQVLMQDARETKRRQILGRDLDREVAGQLFAEGRP